MTADHGAPGILIYSNEDTFGDALLKIPAIQALRKHYPQAHITWLTGRGPSLYASTFAPSVQGLLDEVISNAGIGHSWREIFTSPLQNSFFDIIIDTQQVLKTTLVVRRIPHRLFFSSTANFFFSDAKPSTPKPQAMLDRILQLFSLAAGSELKPVYGVTIPQVYRYEARRLLPKNHYIGIAPGAGQPWKCWPLARFIAVGQWLVTQNKTPVFFLGPQEQEWRTELQQSIPQALFPEAKRNPELPASPYLAMSLGERLEAALCNDSGTSHMLACANRPLITLYGKTSPEKFRPNTERAIAICARDYNSDSMDAIPAEAVIDKLKELIQQ